MFKSFYVILILIFGFSSVVEGGGVEEESIAVVEGVRDDCAVDFNHGAVRQGL